jgi:hypothetical protein
MMSFKNEKISEKELETSALLINRIYNGIRYEFEK